MNSVRDFSNIISTRKFDNRVHNFIEVIIAQIRISWNHLLCVKDNNYCVPSALWNSEEMCRVEDCITHE